MAIKITNGRIKRENWKGKYYVVVRKNGKIRAVSKYSSNNSMSYYKNIWSSNRTLNPDVIKTKLSNVTEVVDYRSKPKLKKGQKFQLITEGEGKTTGYIVARSLRYEKGNKINSREQNGKSIKKSKQQIINESEESFFERVSENLSGKYDATEGRNLAFQDDVKYRTGFVYYV